MRTVRVRAEEQGDGPRLSFQPSKRAGLGYTDEDSAGQQNIFAVEPRQYVAGSSRDTSAGGVAPIILVAGAIGLCILGVGLIFNKDSGPSEDPAADGLSSLSEYSRRFAAERHVRASIAPNEDLGSSRTLIAGCQPHLFHGLVQDWPAFHAWAGRSGLDRLRQLCGSVTVQVMAAGSGVFRGDAFAHTPVSCTFADFLSQAVTSAALEGDGCETGSERGNSHDRLLQKGKGGAEAACRSREAGAETSTVRRGSVRQADTQQPRAVAGAGQGGPADVLLSAGEHLYLAQAPITSSARGRCALAALQEDVTLPACLTGLPVDDTNLWMSIEGSRSSLHYDPYQNLLCVVRGAKRVRLYSPAVTQNLYPMPLYGESPNHSAVDVAAPDHDRHPLYAAALEHELVADVQAGDALFIPEGWWHQIDSDGLTVAVSHWWAGPADVTIAGPDAAPYHLRRLLRAEVERRVSQLLRSIAPLPLVGDGTSASGGSGGERSVLPWPSTTPAGVGGAACDVGEWRSTVGDADGHAGGVGWEAIESKALSVLVLAVGRALEGADTDGSIPRKRRRTMTGGHGPPHQHAGEADYAGRVDSQEGACWNGTVPGAGAAGPDDRAGFDDDVGLGLLEDITRAFATLSPAALRRVLEAAAARFPRTLEALLLHALPPAAAELLTRKLELGDEELLRAGREDEQVRDVLLPGSNKPPTSQ